MTRLHGGRAVDQRLVAKVPHGRWKALTIVAGQRCDGIVAPHVFDRPIIALSSLGWVTKFMMPNCGAATLSSWQPQQPQGGGWAASVSPTCPSN